MPIREDVWLSAIFGHGVYRVESGSEENICDLLAQHAAEQPAAMYYAKVGTDQVDVVRRFAAAGMYVVDVNVTFGIDTRSRVRPADPAEMPGWVIREISPEQHRAVLDIAGFCSRYSRFHLDPGIPDTIAHRIKHDWILSYIRKQRGEQLFVALRDGRPAGFLAVLGSELDGKVIRTIDLVGVDTPFQGQGGGRALVQFFIDRYRDQCDVLQVGTQIANVPSVRLYHALGFDLVKSAYVMHMHVRRP